ncbi:MAG: DUF2330 domain-containing protein [Patescibacteria group bacterium]|jgi:hypothetical protein
MFLKKIFNVLVVLSLFLPQLSTADGMVMPQPDYWVQETAQKAVIFYDGGVETMVVSITFQGDADNFGWVIPTPSKPTITKGSDELFTSLDQLTQIYYGYDDNMMSGGMPLSGTDAEKQVTIIDTQQIEYYEVTTISATDKDALTTWLNDNGYSYPESASYILNSYIDNGWYFVAMKIDTKSLQSDSVIQQLKTGHAVPVAISFETENLVYPMKISSVTSSPENNVGVEYTAGVVNEGVLLENEDKLTMTADNAISSNGGTLEAWIKPNWSAEETKTVNIATVRGGDSNSLLFRFDLNSNITADGYHYTLSTYNDADYTTDTWISGNFALDVNSWQQVALTWQKDKLPSFYLNGSSVPLTAESTKQFGISNFSGDNLYIGSGEYDNRSIDSIVDEFAIYNVANSVDLINDNYNKMNAGEALAVENSTMFLAHFDSSLADEVSGDYLVYAGSDYLAYDQYYSNTASIILYVIDSSKKELPNFNTDYAGWIKKSEIEALALNDQGNYWINPSADKYFLTKLSSTMAYDAMTEDLFFRNADNNDPVNAPGTEDSGRKVVFYIVTAIGLVLTFLILFLLNNQSKFKN